MDGMVDGWDPTSTKLVNGQVNMLESFSFACLNFLSSSCYLVLASQRRRSHYPIPTYFIQSSGTPSFFSKAMTDSAGSGCSEILFSVWITGKRSLASHYSLRIHHWILRLTHGWGLSVNEQR